MKEGSFKVEFYAVLTAPSQPSQLQSDALGTEAVFKGLSSKPEYKANCKPIG